MSAALNELREIHARGEYESGRQEWCGTCDVVHPCPTVEAVEDFARALSEERYAEGFRAGIITPWNTVNPYREPTQ